MAAKEDCIFFKNLRTCNALNELYCKKEEKPCAFYKSKHEYNMNGKKKE